MTFLKDSQLKSVAYFFFWAILFNLSFVPLPLYSSNQNTYFLPGLANAGFGYLKADWLANTIGSFPLFNALVSTTYKLLPEYFFYLYYLIFSAIYIHALVGIVSKIYDIKSGIQKSFIYITVIAFHNTWLIDIVYSLSFINLWGGVAAQRMNPGFFQPSIFAVLLLLSIYAFLYKRYVIAVLLLNITVAFHFSYFVSATILNLCYSFILIKEEGYKSKSKIIKNGIIFATLAIPFLIYVLTTFSPTSPETWNQYQDILVNFRFPHHAKPEAWIRRDSYFKVILVAIALHLIRKTRLFWIIFISYISAIGLTIIQVVSGSNTLALMFPWRISVYLVPISNTIIISYLILNILQNKKIKNILSNNNIIAIITSLIITVIIVSGYAAIVRNNIPDASIAMMNFVKQNKSAKETYLIPPKPLEMERFRLYTGNPIFVDFKSHPYKDIEVIEWFKRITIANTFFDKSSYTQQDCVFVDEISRSYGITHVVNYSDRHLGKVCANLNKVYGDQKYEIYKIPDKK
jgi:hypothetical protein